MYVAGETDFIPSCCVDSLRWSLISFYHLHRHTHGHGPRRQGLTRIHPCGAEFRVGKFSMH